MTQTRISNRSKAEVQCDSSGAGQLESEACVAAKVLTHFFNMESELTVWSLEESGKSGSACFPLGMNIDACIPHITTSWKVPFA